VKLAERFGSLDARLYGVAADSPQQLTRMRSKLAIPFTMLSDPQLTTADQLQVVTSSRHPMARKYPRKAFLQPGLFIWRETGELVYQWRQTPKITNLFGASNRPTPEQILELTETALV